MVATIPTKQAVQSPRPRQTETTRASGQEEEVRGGHRQTPGERADACTEWCAAPGLQAAALGRSGPRNAPRTRGATALAQRGLTLPPVQFAKECVFFHDTESPETSSPRRPARAVLPAPGRRALAEPPVAPKETTAQGSHFPQRPFSPRGLNFEPGSCLRWDRAPHRAVLPLQETQRGKVGLRGSF